MYWPMLAAGDDDLIRPFFNYYRSILDLRTAITKAWFGHDGAYYRENVYLTGAEMDDSPVSKNKPPRPQPGETIPGWYHNYHFNSGLELTTMALEYVVHTQDRDFRDHTLLPLARETIGFYDRHYPREAQGKIRLEPSQVLETYYHNGAGSIALQAMVMQEADGKILLLPAWPTNWDGEFKLHASGQTTVAGRIQSGTLTGLKVTPAARRSAVEICPPYHLR